MHVLKIFRTLCSSLINYNPFLQKSVHEWVTSTLTNRQGKLGGDKATVKHDFTVLDPKTIFGKGGALNEFSGAQMGVPTFMTKDLPPEVEAMKNTIKDADCVLIVSPEYNHVVPPALASLMGHFGGSCYACKPSGIVTYSPGQFGGARAALSIATMCHELGCLPVSKFCHLPSVSSILNVDGNPIDPMNRMLKQLPDLLDQLEWNAVAMKNQREMYGTF